MTFLKIRNTLLFSKKMYKGRRKSTARVCPLNHCLKASNNHISLHEILHLKWFQPLVLILVPWREEMKKLRWWRSRKLLNLWIWKCHMKNVKVTCINLHDCIHVCVNYSQRNQSQTYGKPYVLRRKSTQVCWIKARHSHLVRQMLKGTCQSGRYHGTEQKRCISVVYLGRSGAGNLFRRTLDET